MLSVQPVAPSRAPTPGGKTLKRSMTAKRVSVVGGGPTSIQVQPPFAPSIPRPAIHLSTVARSVMELQHSSGVDEELSRQLHSITEGPKKDDPWASVILKVTRKAGGSVRPESRGNNLVSEGEQQLAKTGKPGLAQLLRSRKVKNLVRQAIVAREWSATASSARAQQEQSMVMEQWVKTTALRNHQQQQQQQRLNRRRTTAVPDAELDGSGPDDADRYSSEDAEYDEEGSSSDSSEDSKNGFVAGLDLSEATRISKQAYSRHLLLEESCRRALAQSGDRRSAMDLQALRSWFQTTKLKISTDFDKLPPAQLDSLCRRMVGVSLAPNEVVFRQGDEGDALYVVFSGSVEVRVSQRVLGEPVEVTVCELVRGDYFGERSLLSNDARAATVIATSSTELVKITRADYDLMLRNDQLEFLSRVQMSNGGSALGMGLPKPLQQSQREYLKILAKGKHMRSKADVALLSEYLQALKFFRTLPVSFVRELCGVIDLICFPSGSTVFHEGEIGDQFYIIFSGSVDVVVGSNDGPKQQTKLINLTEGAHFGELALMKGRGVRSATVVAREESKLLVICEKDYNATLKRLQKRDLSRRVAALDKIPLFQTPEWTREKLRELSYVLVDQKLSTGTVLFKQGEKAQHVYFVVRGELIAERSLINPLVKPSEESAPPSTTTVVAERISRFRIIGDEAAAGATFNETTFREVTITASTPVDLLVLSKYDVYHRLPPAMRHVLRCANLSSGCNPDSTNEITIGPRARVEPVVYVDRFVKSTKWETTKRRLVNENVDHEKIARRLAATAPAVTSPPTPMKSNRKRIQEEESARSELVSPRANADHKRRPLLDANDFILVPPERDAIASAFVRPDCVAGHTSLGRYVTEFNADAPPSAARARQYLNVLAAETRRSAHIRNEGNPLAYFDADDIRQQHQRQLQQQYQQDDGESWSRQSSFKRSIPSSNESIDGGVQSSMGSSVTSMSQCLQENYVFSQPADPSEGLDSRGKRLKQRQHRVSDTGSRRHRSINFDGIPTTSNVDENRDGDLVAIRFRFTADDAAQPGSATSLMILQSVRSLPEAAALASLNGQAKGWTHSPELDADETEDLDRIAHDESASSLFIIAKKMFALPPSEKRRKSYEERMHQQVIERFGRFSVVGGSAKQDSPSSAMIALASAPVSSPNIRDMFGSFEKVVAPASQEDEQVESSNNHDGRKQFAVVSVVLSRRETMNGGCDEPLLCVHSIFSSEAEATDFALRMGPPPLRNALVCVLPTRKWHDLKDAYEWCVQVEPDRREKRASTSALVISPNRNKPPVRMFPPASSMDEPPPKWRTERDEAARLHQFICARMGLPRNVAERGGGGDESGFTPKPASSLEDKLGALREYLDAASANVTASRSVTLGAVSSGPPTASNGDTHTTGAQSSAAGPSVAGGGSKLLGKVRQMKRFGSIMRSRIFSHAPVPSESPGTSHSPSMHRLLPP